MKSQENSEKSVNEVRNQKKLSKTPETGFYEHNGNHIVRIEYHVKKNDFYEVTMFDREKSVTNMTLKSNELDEALGKNNAANIRMGIGLPKSPGKPGVLQGKTLHTELVPSESEVIKDSVKKRLSGVEEKLRSSERDLSKQTPEQLFSKSYPALNLKASASEMSDHFSKKWVENELSSHQQRVNQREQQRIDLLELSNRIVKENTDKVNVLRKEMSFRERVQEALRIDPKPENATPRQIEIASTRKRIAWAENQIRTNDDNADVRYEKGAYIPLKARSAMANEQELAAIRDPNNTDRNKWVQKQVKDASTLQDLALKEAASKDKDQPSKKLSKDRQIDEKSSTEADDKASSSTKSKGKRTPEKEVASDNASQAQSLNFYNEKQTSGKKRTEQPSSINADKSLPQIAPASKIAEKNTDIPAINEPSSTNQKKVANQNSAPDIIKPTKAQSRQSDSTSATIESGYFDYNGTRVVKMEYHIKREGYFEVSMFDKNKSVANMTLKSNELDQAVGKENANSIRTGVGLPSPRVAGKPGVLQGKDIHPDNDNRERVTGNDRNRGNQSEDILSKQSNELVGDRFSKLVPEKVKQKYVQVDDKYYYQGGKELAFEDKGQKLQTKQTSKDIAASLVDVAESRQWEKIKVKGDETFRRNVWSEASMRGIEVEGYKPSEVERAQIEKYKKENGIENKSRQSSDRNPTDNSVENSTSRNRDDFKIAATSPGSKGAFVGALVDHGQAKYMFKDDKEDSYYVKLKSEQGKEKILWGVDLERAIKASDARVGDKVEVENHGRKPITLERKIVDESGKESLKTIETHRNEWEVRHAISRTAKSEVVGASTPTSLDSASDKKAHKNHDEFKIASTSPGSKAFAGELVDHGSAKYKNNEKNEDNYFVKVKSEKGNEKTIWGVDLARAMKESGARVGERIELENLGRKPVTIEKMVIDDHGKESIKKIDTHRNEWEVRAEAIRTGKLNDVVKQHPGLVNEVAAIRVAEKLAETFGDKELRDKFNQRVRDHVSEKVLQSEAIPPVSVKQNTRQESARDQQNARAEIAR